jgi:hypothetical protein
MADERVPSNPDKYPAWVKIDGHPVLMFDHYHHGSMIGKKLDQNGEEIVEAPPPEVLSEPEPELTAEALFGKEE